MLIHASQTQNDPELFHDFDVSLDVPRGAIVGVVNVVDCSLEPRSQWHEEGQYGWYLEGARRFLAPISYKGAVGIMKVALEVVEEAFQTAEALVHTTREMGKSVSVKRTPKIATKTVFKLTE